MYQHPLPKTLLNLDQRKKLPMRNLIRHPIINLLELIQINLLRLRLTVLVLQSDLPHGQIHRNIGLLIRFDFQLMLLL